MHTLSDEDFYHSDQVFADAPPPPPPSFDGSPSALDSSSCLLLSPDSSEARNLIMNDFQLTEHQYEQFQSLSRLIVSWNTRINLVSRKDCNLSTVFSKHILPSLGLLQLLLSSDKTPSLRIADVGTGGGFPGLPLAIALPQHEFVLIDSVGKKLHAIDDIITALGLTNVQTHHGRAEEMIFQAPSPKQQQHKHSYDICVGRSVAAVPKFCFWIQDLLKVPNGDGGSDGGKLLYMIGGDLDGDILDRAEQNLKIGLKDGETLLSEKRILVFSQPSVLELAQLSGEKPLDAQKIQRKLLTATRNHPNFKPKRLPKGAWAKRDNATPKQRGYENFKRYGY